MRRSLVALAPWFFFVLLARLPPPSLGCSTFLVGRNASADGSVFVTHSDDGEGNPDARLAVVPARTHAPGSTRPVWPDLEDNPRFVGTARGATYAPGVSVPADTPPTAPIGAIPQVPSTYAYLEGNYGIMNERQLSIGESTCSGRFVASAIGAGGDALFCVNELSRVAMERCATARCAVKLMGHLAVTYGFYGAAGSFEGGSETLLIADAEGEGWVMHFVPYPRTNSAVWVARRVPDDHVTVVMNMFTIREVDLSDDRNYLASENLLDVALEHGLWNPETDGAFDFTRAYSAGEYAHKYYSGRRVWGAFRLVDPSANLSATYGDLRLDAPYPFSLKPDAPVSARDLFAWHRDWYERTPYDLGAGLAAGPWGSPDRMATGVAYEEGEADIGWGAFERPIALHRTTYTHVVQTRGWLPDDIGGVVWYGPHAAHGTCFVPIPAGVFSSSTGGKGGGADNMPSDDFEEDPSRSDGEMESSREPTLRAQTDVVSPLAASLVVGNASVVDRSSSWWAHRFAHNVATSTRWSFARRLVEAEQETWETRGVELVEKFERVYAREGGDIRPEGDPVAAEASASEFESASSPGDLASAMAAHAAAVRDAWWALADEIVRENADGFYSPRGAEKPGAEVGFPARWLERVGWRDGPDPPPEPPKAPTDFSKDAKPKTPKPRSPKAEPRLSLRGGRKTSLTLS